MTQEDKQLLLKELCARLPYGLYANLPNHHLVSHKYIIHDINIQSGWTTGRLDCAGRIQVYSAKVEDIKPYLRPMSSITLEELEEYRKFGDHVRDAECKIHIANYNQIDWLNRNHFDYRGLIQKGLALEATEGMYK